MILHFLVDLDIRFKENLNFTMQSQQNVNTIFDTFHKLLTETVNQYAPIRDATRKEIQKIEKPWLTDGIILKSIENKHKLYAKKIKYNNPTVTSEYNVYRNNLNRLITRSIKNANERKIMLSKSKSKTMWQIINEILTKNKKKETPQ